MMRCRWRPWTWVIAAAVGAWAAQDSFSAAQTPDPRDSGTSAARPAKAESKGAAIKPASPEAQRNRLVKEFAKRLGAMLPKDSRQKDMNSDYFLVGTADLNNETKHADVKFDFKQGQQSTAEFLADYVMNESESVSHKWHVFARFKETQQAQQGLTDIRQQYDQMVAYQEQIKRIYAAASVTRC